MRMSLQHNYFLDQWQQNQVSNSRIGSLYKIFGFQQLFLVLPFHFQSNLNLLAMQIFDRGWRQSLAEEMDYFEKN